MVVAVALIVLAVLGNPALALVTGMVLSLTLNRAPIAAGNRLSKYLLQTAIVLLGFKLNAEHMLDITGTYALPIASFVCVTGAVGCALGWLFRNEKETNALVSGGTAICGGTAIATLSPVIGARPEQTGAALCIVFLLNAAALVTFPTIGHWLELSQEQFGVWAALAIHDTSSVVATAQIYGEEAATVATTVKIGRTLWLIPLVVIASLYVGAGQSKIRIPGFVFAFIAASVLGSWLELDATLTSLIGHGTSVLLVSALFFIGCEITRETLRGLRVGVVLHAVTLWLLAIPTVLLGVLTWVP
jgi:uncharacterized integral membrane protein (TIGR00698 family)